MRDPHDVIIRPVLTEAAYDRLSEQSYTFIVAVDATKVEIRNAVEAVFPGVKVERVNTANKEGKIKRMGRFAGRRAATKKAYVKLTENSKGIEFFEGMAQ